MFGGRVPAVPESSTNLLNNSDIVSFFYDNLLC